MIAAKCQRAVVVQMLLYDLCYYVLFIYLLILLLFFFKEKVQYLNLQ